MPLNYIELDKGIICEKENVFIQLYIWWPRMDSETRGEINMLNSYYTPSYF